MGALFSSFFSGQESSSRGPSYSESLSYFGGGRKSRRNHSKKHHKKTRKNRK